MTEAVATYDPTHPPVRFICANLTAGDNIAVFAPSGGHPVVTHLDITVNGGVDVATPWRFYLTDGIGTEFLIAAGETHSPTDSTLASSIWRGQVFVRAAEFIDVEVFLAGGQTATAIVNGFFQLTSPVFPAL